jgi:hypothetical protein
MLSLNFLRAEDGTPLSKKFVATPQGITKDTYPLVSNFVSFSIEVETLDEFLQVLEIHAEQQHCLLKGLLDKPLNGESRAQHTNSVAPTKWVCLDLDTDKGFSNVDAFLASIGIFGTSYILHHSASAGITSDIGLRTHVYMMLSEPITPPLLKDWLRHLNLNTPELFQQLQLTANGMSLRWPLDTTTCQNDKLIFIAPPTLEGLSDPIEKRFEIHHKQSPHLTIDLSTINSAQITARTQGAVNDLRMLAGYPRRKARYAPSTHVLLNPEQATVTGERHARGFVYLNLNGGDSWGYYYPEDNPTILYNFKGEPNVRLQDIAPDYWQNLPQHRALQPVDHNTTRFIVRDNRSDSYYTCIWHPNDEYMELNRAQRAHLADFMAHHGDDMPDAVPEWEITFDPTTTEVYKPEQRWINTYRPTKYIKEPLSASPSIPPIISMILNSLCADDAKFKAHFLNWLAYIFQTRKKTKTAFLFHGVEGTGKGLLYQQVLSPLFGSEHTTLITTDTLQDRFNGWAHRKIFVCVDEFAVEAKDSRRIPEILRNLITEDTMALREMRRDVRTVDNSLNLILFTNVIDPFRLPESDRRYNVSPRQTSKLIIGQAEIDQIPDELPAFAAFLQTYDVDEERVVTALNTDAKNAMRLAAEGTGDRIIRAFASGDTQFFADLRSTNKSDPDPQRITYNAYVNSWIANPEWTHVELDVLRTIHQHLTGGRITKIALQRMLEVHLGPLTKGGFNIKWAPAVDHFETPENVAQLRIVK